MPVVELRDLLLGIGLLLTVAVGAAVWFDRWLHRRVAPDPLQTTALWELLPIGVSLFDLNNSPVYVNPTAQRLLHFSASAKALPDSAWVPMLLEDIRLARSTGTTSARTLFLEQEKQWRRWWVTAWQNQTVLLVEDATTLQHAEQNAHRMISDLTHEIRTPVATLLTHVEVLKLPHLPDDTRAQSLAFMQGEGQRLEKLVQHMTDLTRLETSASFELRPVDVVELAAEVVAQSHALALEKQIRLILHHDPVLPLALGDRGRLKQLFLNLVENALKYCRAHDQVEITLQRTERGLSCVVADTGPGISEKHLPYITNRFYRVGGERVSGNGLGLAFVVEILRRHQSTLNISSRTEPPTGTTFSFILPLADSHPKGA